eukprot:6740041-Pyramimonas_sp.AAC.1
MMHDLRPRVSPLRWRHAELVVEVAGALPGLEFDRARGLHAPRPALATIKIISWYESLHLGELRVEPGLQQLPRETSNPELVRSAASSPPIRKGPALPGKRARLRTGAMSKEHTEAT